MCGIIGRFYKETVVRRAIKPAGQMGMLMSANSTSSLLTRNVTGREGLETELEVVERPGSYQRGGKPPSYQGW